MTISDKHTEGTLMNEETGVQLRDFVERILEEREKQFNATIENLMVRIERLNELREEVVKDRDQFLRLGEYREMHKAVLDRVEKLESIHARFIGVAIALVALTGFIGLMIGHLWK